MVKTIRKPRNCSRRAEPGDRLTVHYVGRIGDSIKGKKFDSSRDKDVPFQFTWGEGKVRGSKQKPSEIFFVIAYSSSDLDKRGHLCLLFFGRRLCFPPLDVHSGEGDRPEEAEREENAKLPVQR